MDITARLSRIEIDLERISTQIPSFEMTDRDVDAQHISMLASQVSYLTRAVAQLLACMRDLAAELSTPN
jgi:hypothetical protein